MSAVSMIKTKGLTVNDKVWTPAHMRLLKRAASYPEVERILVHPGIKKKLCDTVTGDRSWLRKVRPFWGHDYHFHIRIGCQPGSTGCKAQAQTTPRRRLRQVAGLVVHRRAMAPQQEPRCAEGPRPDDDGEPAQSLPRRAGSAIARIGGRRHLSRQGPHQRRGGNPIPRTRRTRPPCPPPTHSCRRRPGRKSRCPRSVRNADSRLSYPGLYPIPEKRAALLHRRIGRADFGRNDRRGDFLR